MNALPLLLGPLVQQSQKPVESICRHILGRQQKRPRRPSNKSQRRGRRKVAEAEYHDVATAGGDVPVTSPCSQKNLAKASPLLADDPSLTRAKRKPPAPGHAARSENTASGKEV